MTSTPPRARGARVCVLAYAVAAAAAAAVAYLAGGHDHPILAAACADVAATLVVFAFSRAHDNSSLYDPYWSVAPIAIAAFWMTAPGPAEPARAAAVLFLVAAWGVRLTYNWWAGWSGLDHEDWRYRRLRETSGRAYWLVSFAGIHLFPTVMVFLGCLAIYPAVAAGARPLGVLDAVAAAVTIAAIAIEAIADADLRAFVASRPPPGAVMERGLWRYSRHPNYFGEALLWWGLWLFALAADPAWWWTVVGPLAITAMFLFVSIPMMEARSVERRPGYADVQRRVSRLVPWFRRAP